MEKTFSPSYSSSQITYVEVEEFLCFHRKRTALTSLMQTIQNTALPIASSCTRDTNAGHLHSETKVLSMGIHLKLYATQLKLWKSRGHSKVRV